MKNTLLKTALVLNILLCSINLYGGEIGESPKLRFQPNISKVEPFAKALNFNTSFPPEERKKVLMQNKQKTNLKKKKKKEPKEFEGYVTILGIDFWPLEFTMLIFALLLPIGGVIAFAIGASLLNPVMWIIGLASVVLGLLLLLILNFRLYTGSFAVISLIWSAVFILAGITLFIVGLVLGIMSLWIGGIVFFAAVILFFLIGFLLAVSN